MAALATAAKPVLPPGSGRLFEPRRVTLDERVSATWRRLAEEGSAECLVCGASEFAAGHECPGCGSELS